jgi:hypothetical protein
VSRIAERHRLEAETLAIQSRQSPPSLPLKRTSTPSQALLDRTSRLVLATSQGERPEILGPTRDLLVSGGGKVVGAVRKPLRGLGNFVFGDGGESPPSSALGLTESGRRGEITSRGPSPLPGEDEGDVRLANVEIERAERAEREQRGQTLEMLSQMFPGIPPPQTIEIVGS